LVRRTIAEVSTMVPYTALDLVNRMNSDFDAPARTSHRRGIRSRLAIFTAFRDAKSESATSTLKAM
jgi:hypothetical protein